MSRAAIYRRVSTAGQVDGFSLEGQLDRLTSLAERLGYEWEDFCDSGISGEKLEERGEIMRLLRSLDRFDAVMVVDESRLARREDVAFAIRGAFREARVRLITPDGETNLSDPGESAMSAVRTVFAVMEQHTRTRRMTEGLDRAAERGLWTGGPAPLGYRLQTTPSGHTTLVIDPEGAEFLRLAVAMVVDEDLTAYQAAKRLNAQGYRTRKGTPWSHRNLAKHLQRRHLLGEIPYQSANSPVTRAFPPLISEERFDQLQAALRRNARRAPRKAHTYPYSGRITCQCGGRLVGTYRNDRDTRYYVCHRLTNSALTGDTCPHRPRQRRADTLEQMLFEPIRATLSDPTRLEAAAKAMLSGARPDPRAIQNTIRDRQRRLAEISDERRRTFRDGPSLGLTASEIRSALAELAGELNDLERDIRALEGQHIAAQRNRDTTANLRRLAATAAAQLETPDLELQTAVIELLDIRVKTTEDGYEITGSIPLDLEVDDGKMPTRTLQVPS